MKLSDVETILKNAVAALSENGILLLEAHTFSAVKNVGEKPPFWYSSDSGLLSDQSHICLRESVWDADRKSATDRYYVVDAWSAEVTRYAQNIQAYADEEYKSLLLDCGYAEIKFDASMGTGNYESQREFIVITARKR